MSSTVSANVAVIVGSLRKDSFNRRAAHVLAKLAPEGLRLEIVEIGQLPHFDQDLEAEGQTPESWTAFRNKIKTFDAVLFLTPEYNRSIPGVLKNAIDVGSRPYGKSVWNGKPAAVMSITAGALGGFGANHHLRQSLSALNMPLLSQPEAYVGNAGTLFDDDGNLVNEGTQAFFKTFIDAFASWIGTVTGKTQSAKAA